VTTPRDIYASEARLPDILYASDGRVHLVHSEQPPLDQLPTRELADGTLLVPGCGICAWTGYDLALYARDVLAPCPACGGLVDQLQPYADEDGDGWLDGVARSVARWTGGERPLDAVTLAVIHRYSAGRGEAGPRYVRNPTGRHVSWHATAHHAGWERRATLHLPVQQIGWHAGDREVNRASIGIECDAAVGGDPHAPYDAATIDVLEDLLRSWGSICPRLRYLTGHADILPQHRQDPGRRFPRGLLAARLGWPWLGHDQLRLALAEVQS